MTTTNTTHKASANKKITYTIALLIALVVLMGILFGYSSIKAQQDKEYINIAGEQRLLSQRMLKYATSAAQADVDAFGRLRETHDRFKAAMDQLQHGDAEIGLPPSPKDVQPQLDALIEQWEKFSANTEIALAAEGTTRMLREFIKALTELMPDVQKSSSEVVDVMVAAGYRQSQIQIAANQVTLAQRIEFNLVKMINGDETAASAAEIFNQDVKRFGEVLTGMPLECGHIGLAGGRIKGHLDQLDLLVTDDRLHGLTQPHVVSEDIDDIGGLDSRA